MHALGVAGSLASGLSMSLRDGSDEWRAHAGFGTGQGLLVARLAQEGLTGPRSVLDDQRGFCAAFTDGRYHLEAPTRGLGSRLLILEAAFKLHSVAHVWALPLDALAHGRRRRGSWLVDERGRLPVPPNARRADDGRRRQLLTAAAQRART